MKTLQNWFWLVMLAGAGSAFDADAQGGYTRVGPPPWTNTTVQTVGGITYFTHMSRVHDCHRVAPGPVYLVETNIVQTINEEVPFGGACVACIDCYHSETHVSVFGTLAPGDYRLQILSWNESLGRETLFTTTQFSVPVSSTPAVSGWMNTNASSFNLAVAGVPNVRYIIQTSATFADWTSVSTNSAPFVWSEPIAPAISNRFYRVLMVGD